MTPVNCSAYPDSLLLRKFTSLRLRAFVNEIYNSLILPATSP